MAAGFWAMFLYDSLIAPLVAGLGFDETELGLILAAVGAGGVLGALGSGRGRGPPAIRGGGRRGCVRCAAYHRSRLRRAVRACAELRWQY